MDTQNTENPGNDQNQKMINDFKNFCDNLVNEYKESLAHNASENIKEHYHNLKDRLTKFTEKVSHESLKFIALVKDPESVKQIKEIVKNTLKKLSD